MRDTFPRTVWVLVLQKPGQRGKFSLVYVDTDVGGVSGCLWCTMHMKHVWRHDGSRTFERQEVQLLSEDFLLVERHHDPSQTHVHGATLYVP